MKKNEGARTAGKSLLNCGRNALIACALGVALVLAFAFMLKQQWLKMSFIPYVNTGIKIICACAAALLSAFSIKNRAPVWGAVSGGMYMVLTLTVFSLIAGRFAFETALLTDLAMCMIAGFIVGVVFNLKR